MIYTNVRMAIQTIQLQGQEMCKDKLLFFCLFSSKKINQMVVTNFFQTKSS